MRRCLAVLVLCAATLAVSGCGYNTLQAQDEQVKSSWAEVRVGLELRIILDHHQQA